MDELPSTIRLEELSFSEILKKFNPPRKLKYKLPRIAFIGYFQFLSMTRQREICKNLGFEYFSEIEMATADENKIQILMTKWPDITRLFTRLIIIGNHCDRTPADELEPLFKTYKKDTKPVFVKYSIPCMMEKQLFKINRDYPDIHMNTRWEDNMLSIDELDKMH